MSESFDITLKLDDQEVDILHQIKAQCNKDGYDWSFNQILGELAVIGITNWKHTRAIEKAIWEGRPRSD